MQATLKGLSAKFSRATETMRWLRQCASTLSRETKQTVAWTTPLGLRCVQPYLKNVRPLRSVQCPLRCAGCLFILHSALPSSCHLAGQHRRPSSGQAWAGMQYKADNSAQSHLAPIKQGQGWP